MKLLPILALTLLLAVGGLTACGDDTQNANVPDGAATSASDETESEQETEDAPAESETAETAETAEATNPHVIAYCKVVATMAKQQEAGKDFGAGTAKLSDLTTRIAKADSLTEADTDALNECSAQLEEVYKAG